MRRIVTAMGLIATLLSLFGCAGDLPNQEEWEAEVQAAAAAVAPDGDLQVAWKVRGGLSEMRRMEIETTIQGTLVDAEQLGLEIEAAVAPVVVRIPQRGTLGLSIYAQEGPSETRYYHWHSASFDEIAEKYGLTRER